MATVILVVAFLVIVGYIFFVVKRGGGLPVEPDTEAVKKRLAEQEKKADDATKTADDKYAAYMDKYHPGWRNNLPK